MVAEKCNVLLKLSWVWLRDDLQIVADEIASVDPQTSGRCWTDRAVQVGLIVLGVDSHGGG